MRSIRDLPLTLSSENTVSLWPLYVRIIFPDCRSALRGATSPHILVEDTELSIFATSDKRFFVDFEIVHRAFVASEQFDNISVLITSDY